MADQQPRAQHVRPASAVPGARRRQVAIGVGLMAATVTLLAGATTGFFRAQVPASPEEYYVKNGALAILASRSLIGLGGMVEHKRLEVAAVPPIKDFNLHRSISYRRSRSTKLHRGYFEV